MSSQQQTLPIPYLRLHNEFNALRAEWMEMIGEIGLSGAFILGPNVRQFEQEVTTYLGCTHAVSVANGTDAIELSLRALGIGPGDKVITSPFTFFATAEAISKVGATPVFADIDPDSFTLDPVSVKSKIDRDVKAILPVHIFGHPADMGVLSSIAGEHGLHVIEDGAQAFGAIQGGKYAGAHGQCGCFSFYPTKVLGCYGDGGLITTDSDQVRDRLLRLRNHGASSPFMHDELGYNSRLDEIQAALLRIKLRKIEQDIAARIRVADLYDEQLGDLPLRRPSRPGNGRHVFNLYTIRHPRRDMLRAALKEANIGHSQCYPLGLHLQAVYSHLGYQPGDLPVTDLLCGETLSLPIFPDMHEEEIERVSEVIKRLG
ncbi:MAG: DegT/DnrJ/EryC1/StrS family aminotransferase [Gammaproteobacteria bacterium]|nr:DegT/DnrJ/EryC1/StrS family aminotransferase [Gammaproteobacteria bacterium]MBU1654734.1 DegT/DnrJ/EryC1/StrS family aminotransferase [Gammaproteobacteria bacterium]MBU1959655.1 DegT/DnrJ/EryC1/StrS family aminotransferase [Gammaproteobacteria bacterium]